MLYYYVLIERSRLKYERLSKIIISMKAGIGHLQDKLESFREEISGKSYVLGDDTVAEVLRECEVCFITLNKRIKAAEDETKRSSITSTQPKSLLQKSQQLAQQQKQLMQTAEMLNAELEDNTLKMNTMRPFNQRIDLSFSDENLGMSPTGGGFNNDDDNSMGDLDDEELTRDKVKRASSQILQAMDKKKKKPKKKAAGPGSAGLSLSMNMAAADDESVPSSPFKSPALKR